MATFELLGKDGAGHRSGARHRLCDGARARRSRRLGVDRGPRRRAGRGGRRADPRHARAGLAADVTDRGALQRAVATAIERFGVARRGGRQRRHRLARGDAAGRWLPRPSSGSSTSNLFGVCRTRRCGAPGDRRAPGPRRRDLLDLCVHQRRRRDPLRDEQGRRRAAGSRAASRARSCTARAPASPTSASSTPRWSTGRSTRTRWRPR